MERRLLPSCIVVVATILWAHAGTVSAAAQTEQTREGIITTFAPVVEKVAPSVVTVFTTQTVSRGLTTFPFSDDTLRQFFGGPGSSETRQTDDARSRLGRDCQSGWIHSHGQSR